MASSATPKGLSECKTNVDDDKPIFMIKKNNFTTSYQVQNTL